jgi:hypothetical protein
MADRPLGTLTIIGAVLMAIGVASLVFAFRSYLQQGALGFAMFGGFIILFAGFVLFSFSRKQREGPNG